ncbi:MAG: RDD family protein [Chloroflexota bacterium]
MTPVLAKPIDRLKAFAWDYLLLLGYSLLLALLTLIPGLYPLLQRFFAGPVRSDISAFVLMILPVVLYFSLSEAGPSQGTWGKRRVGIQVRGTHEPGLMQSLIRSLVKFLPWQLGHTAVFQLSYASPPIPAYLWILTGLAYGLAGLYLAMLWLSPKHRTLYDWAAGTIVVRC